MLDMATTTNMDALVRPTDRISFVGCPGKDSVLNAGWFSLQPDCGAFKRTDGFYLGTERHRARPRQWDMSADGACHPCEINQCVGCMLALSGEEPGTPRHQTG